jgi:diaminopimelate epimerase
MCGNGLRCFAAYLFHEKLVNNKCLILTDDGEK